MVRARWSLLVVAACGAPSPPRSAAPAVARDPHSHAEPDRVAVRHLALDLTVDFAHHQLRGVARLALDRKDRAAPLRLDVDGPTIEAVTACDGTRLAHRLGPVEPVIGRALEIDLGAADCVAITYATGPDARALLWVDPAGTTSGAQPMLFTESESIHARTWIPIQDTPSVKFTYDATIHVPAGVRPVMSAENPDAPAADGSWHFRMAQPIPSYLVALAVGELAFRPIGPRTGVYAEPAVVDAAAHEFAEVEQMVTTAERLYGPYRWGRYDLLVLPPSFPYGGMENPRLTFLTPTVITGDRALVGLIAHELAHSWSGNLVTNATWSDFWLNEGVTSYLEIRIMEALRGPEVAEVSWYLDRKDLDEAFAKTAPADTRLALAIPASRAPDDVPSDAAYQKGALLLRTLERAFGRDAFDRFLRGWFDRHAFRSATTAMFEAAARAELLPGRPGAMTADALHAWLHDPGLPASAPAASTTRVTELSTAAAAFAAGAAPPEPAGWTTRDWVVFLRALPATIAADRLRALDDKFALTTTHNAEIAMYWLPMRVRAGDHGADAAIEAFLVRVGRRRMIEPLYQAMVARDDTWRALARRIYAQARGRYHPIVRAPLDKLIGAGGR